MRTSRLAGFSRLQTDTQALGGRQPLQESVLRRNLRVRALPTPIQKKGSRPQHKDQLTEYIPESADQANLDVELLSREFRAARFRRSVQQGDIKAAMQQVRSLADSLRRSEIQLAEAASEQCTSERTQQWSLKAAQYFAQTFQSSHVGFFSLCIRKRKLDSALEFARLLPPEPQLFTPLLKTCLDFGDLHAVMKAIEVSRRSLALLTVLFTILLPCCQPFKPRWRALQIRTAVGVPEDAFCYSALLKAASREGNPAKVDAIFANAWQSGIHDPAIFNVIISQHNAKQDTKVCLLQFCFHTDKATA